MTFQMRKVQPAGVKSVLYFAEMFPGVALNRPAVMKGIAGKSVTTYYGWGKTAAFLNLKSSPVLSSHLSGSEGDERTPLGENKLCASWLAFTHPTMRNPEHLLFLHRARQASYT